MNMIEVTQRWTMTAGPWGRGRPPSREVRFVVLPQSLAEMDALNRKDVHRLRECFLRVTRQGAAAPIDAESGAWGIYVFRINRSLRAVVQVDLPERPVLLRVAPHDEVARLVSRYRPAVVHWEGGESESQATSSTANRTTSLAARLAGRRRPHLREDWAAVLAGDSEGGMTLSPRRQLMFALGFLAAAVRMRLHDLARPVWRPVDWLLRATARTEAFITTCVGSLAIYIDSHDGFHALVTDGWGWCGGCGLALFGLTRWLRRIRGIELTGVRTPSDGS